MLDQYKISVCGITHNSATNTFSAELREKQDNPTARIENLHDVAPRKTGSFQLESQVLEQNVKALAVASLGRSIA